MALSHTTLLQTQTAGFISVYYRHLHVSQALLGLVFIYRCFGLAWINARCPPKLLYRSPSSAGRGRGNMMKGSRVEITTGRDHSPITVTDKTD